MDGSQIATDTIIDRETYQAEREKTGTKVVEDCRFDQGQYQVVESVPSSGPQVGAEDCIWGGQSVGSVSPFDFDPEVHHNGYSYFKGDFDHTHTGSNVSTTYNFICRVPL